MVMVFNIGLMELIMKETGSWIKQKGKEHFGMLRVIFIEVNLKTTWLTGTENILISMDLSIKENFMMMFKKVMGKKNGLMELNILEAIRMVWNMGMEYTNGPMEVAIKVIGTQIKFQNMVSTFGMMEELIKAIG